MTQKQKKIRDKILAHIIFYGGSFVVMYGALCVLAKIMNWAMGWFCC